jgi:hypothetical protein
MGRPQTIVDRSEIEEIVLLKIKDLGGVKSKLTYNNVWNFNKELVAKKVKRKNGKGFNLYGYAFWASAYNGEDYYGKLKIDEIKSVDKVIVAGESFQIDFEDILIMVDKLSKKPQELSRRLIKIFERDRIKARVLKEQNDKLNMEIANLRKRIDSLERGFGSMFFNSIDTNNSLNDVMSLKMKGDTYVIDELKNMFNADEDKIFKLFSDKSNNEKNSDTIIDISNRAKIRAKLESEGL